MEPTQPASRRRQPGKSVGCLIAAVCNLVCCHVVLGCIRFMQPCLVPWLVACWHLCSGGVGHEHDNVLWQCGACGAQYMQ